MNASNCYQCGHRYCRKRYHFKRPLERYKRPPKGTVWRGGELVCGTCHKGTLHRVNVHIRKWNRQHVKCECGSIPYPHREGSVDANHGLCACHPEFEL